MRSTSQYSSMVPLSRVTPFRAVMTSPGMMPASSATPPGFTPLTHTPAIPSSSSTKAMPLTPIESSSPSWSFSTTSWASGELMAQYCSVPLPALSRPA